MTRIQRPDRQEESIPIRNAKCSAGCCWQPKDGRCLPRERARRLHGITILYLVLQACWHLLRQCLISGFLGFVMNEWIFPSFSLLPTQTPSFTPLGLWREHLENTYLTLFFRTTMKLHRLWIFGGINFCYYQWTNSHSPFNPLTYPEPSQLCGFY